MTLDGVLGSDFIRSAVVHIEPAAMPVDTSISASAPRAPCGSNGSGFAPRQVGIVMRRPEKPSSVFAITSVPPPRYGDG